ncbi:hypothetical protein POL68_11985 [Stigmatella sp. ncwal1]|uniref:Uncharacterized protein n=1 Tax=Stigmatella ashevillensis TaxID=2995309 RepID=A0ABT5D699_9BACT|nr:hypothetical protein [Stigmatella ashevillena]MDC0709184.1 hypothetical protein [Stigmatella ashevillena]
MSKRLEAGRFRVPEPVEGQAAVHLEAGQLAEVLSLVETGSVVRQGPVH